ncbi:hypothetical protein BDV96DRAFT_564179 [Lophiotrema nucula]|uniref:Uncharacterized protein n=1 Tax=Lophiotrema nucula TaxID=690887 RepID=A0A6A5ZRA0_9PLEO|nr:hypothetical protein BDV96DRAFT_564179 [Lophiotrema nucula]
MLFLPSGHLVSCIASDLILADVSSVPFHLRNALGSYPGNRVSRITKDIGRRHSGRHHCSADRRR